MAQIPGCTEEWPDKLSVSFQVHQNELGICIDTWFAIQWNDGQELWKHTYGPLTVSVTLHYNSATGMVDMKGTWELTDGACQCMVGWMHSTCS